MKTENLKVYPLLSKIEFFCDESLIPETATEVNKNLLETNPCLLNDTFQTGKVPFLKKSTFVKVQKTFMEYVTNHEFKIWLFYGKNESSYCFTYYIQRNE